MQFLAGAVNTFGIVFDSLLTFMRVFLLRGPCQAVQEPTGPKA